ncbi:endonuclease/exonuclease/phosphatase family protein [Neisseria subflava]|uniref:endonuclease/exonuclease/phosphatase family protein n=1 Tax=Neisseria subflava TaxID=28449 RepID=UPI0010BE7502|nr:endonuclease/exonuclease/phosphatase family protein [Neisseria subflava]MCL9786910.1 endonuclease/exonuclease/phosphatase family protein [Neisseria subflava]QCL70943.1 EEP domain-containing protein [Neisseria subflava]WMS17557.1 endonuclease/exonuclease/phosphatase family protein [Neisseria subflava]
MSPRPVTITSYNMHKGMSALNRKVQVNRMADALGALGSDVLFLQEVQGQHLNRSRRTNFPDAPHYDIIGDSLDYHRSYGKNAVYPKRHHGNAILSRLPLKTENNLNISVNKLEQRGLLHCEVVPEGWEDPLVCLCVHLNLREPDRLKQYRAISDYVGRYISPESPLIIAGDFNDWRQKSARELGRALDLNEVFVDNTGKRPKTFPSRLPILSLDRIYTRNLDVIDSEIHNSKDWQHLSDHLPLSVTVRPHRKMNMKSDRKM